MEAGPPHYVRGGAVVLFTSGDLSKAGDMRKNAICALGAILIWATMAPVTKTVLTSLPSMEVLCISALFAVAVLFVMAFVSGRLIHGGAGGSGARSARVAGLARDAGNARAYAKMAGLGFIGIFAYSALYYEGIDRLSSQEACIINYLWPAMLVVFSCLILKEKMTLPKAGALICSFAGIVVLSSGGGADGAGRLAGIVCCLGAAACYGLFSVLNKMFALDAVLTMMTAWLTGAACSWVFMLLTGQSWVPVTRNEWPALIWLGAGVSALAYLLWALAVNGSENTAAIANLAYLTPLLSVVISAIFLHERLGLRTLIAMVLIVGGILVQSLIARER